MSVAEAVHKGSVECYDAGCTEMACRLAKVDALKAPAPDSRSIGSVLLVEPGCLVYSADEEYIQGAERYPRGGVVIEVIDSPVDQETGEAARSFRCLRVRHGKLHAEVLKDSEVDRTRTMSPLDGEMRGLVRVAARELAMGKGVFTPRTAELAKWIHVLTGLVMGSRR